ncbi:homeobox protein 2 [Microplitis demolitor]|uniref:homeobox protein 2 n=1 Tax=Microplitis demolitor TaxID=69319 RepID=UPI0004CD65EC|nr:homeobox protein 2 [Microplitis demolitor]
MLSFNLRSSKFVLLLVITIASFKSIPATSNLYNNDHGHGESSLINNNNAASVRHDNLNLLNNKNNNNNINDINRKQRSVNTNLHNYYNQQRSPLDYIVNPTTNENYAEQKKQREHIPLYIDDSTDNDNDDEDDDDDDDENDDKDYERLAEIINNNKLSKASMEKIKENQDMYYRKRRSSLENGFIFNNKYNAVKRNYPGVENLRSTMNMSPGWASLRNKKSGAQDDLDILFGLHKDDKNKNLSDKTNMEANKNKDKSPIKNTLNMNSINPTVETHNSNNVNPTVKAKAKPTDFTKEQVHISSKQKKNIDWSQYFGIDKRMRKPTWSFDKPGFDQKEDDEWLLQHYYQTMADYLNDHPHLSSVNSNDNDNYDVNNYKMKRNNENKIDNIVKYSREPADTDQIYLNEDEDSQKVKDKILSQLAAAYSLEKMRKALDELKHNIKINQQQSPGETFDREFSTKDSREKKNYNSKVYSYDDFKGQPHLFHEKKKSECPSAELEILKQHCMPVNNFIGGQMLFLPCIRHQVCKMCSDNIKEEKKCINFFAIEAARICDNIEEDDDSDDVVAARESCKKIAVSVTQIQIPPRIVQETKLCYKIIAHRDYNSCLDDYHPEHHNYFNNNNNNNYYPYKM